MEYDDASSSQFSLQPAGLAEDLFKVQSYQTHDLSIAKHYSFTVQVKADYTIAAKTLLEKPAALTTNWGLEKVYLHGYITDCQVSGHDNLGRLSYTLTLVSPLYKLARRVTKRVFINKNIQEIAQQIFEQAKLTDYEFKLNKTYTQRPYTVQQDETDLFFLQRLFAQEGIYYNFSQQQNKAVLQITDTQSYLPEYPDKKLPFVEHSGQAAEEESVYFLSESGADKYILKSDCRGLQCGQKFTLTDHPQQNKNQAYRITAIDIKASQQQAMHEAYDTPINKISYQAKITALADSENYQPKIIP